MSNYETILPGALGKGQVDVPVHVYLPDQTEVGRAVVDLEEGTAVITIKTDSRVATLLSEQLAGLSIMYFDRDAAEEIINKQGEETDGR